MTNIEAKDKLKARVSWKKPTDARFSFLNFTAPESGRYLQEEHSAVNIGVIYDTVLKSGVGNSDFQTYLDNLKDETILQMLHDVFSDKPEITEDWLTNKQLFDYAIILKCTTKVLDNVVNSRRINNQETVTKENIQKYFYDLNGIKDRENGVFTQGFFERYRREIDRIKKVLFATKGKRLQVTTAR